MLLVIKEYFIDSVHCHHLKVTSIGYRIKIPRPSVRSRNGLVINGILAVRQLVIPSAGGNLPRDDSLGSRQYHVLYHQRLRSASAGRAPPSPSFETLQNINKGKEC